MASSATAGTIWFWTESAVISQADADKKFKPLPLIQNISKKSPI